jgi:mono/diheme cytochrome c family protein
MRPKEDYTRFAVVCLILTLAILVSFQIYILREPARIGRVEAQDNTLAVAAGQALFQKNCTLCHGDTGEGDSAPALKDKGFLNATDDSTIFSVVSSGIPGTDMPAWNESHGGPLTDEEVTQLVAFIRSWQPTAADIRSAPPNGNSDRGEALYDMVCAVCHGENGKGTATVAAMNDPYKLASFDDTWYRETIAKGRPATGMPTWGTVLSPQQISDLIAIIDIWRHQAASAGITATAPITTTPVTTAITTTPPVTATAPVSSSAITTETTEIARPSNPGGPGAALNLTGNVASGEKIFVDNCQKCHGPQGTGGVENPGSDDGTIPPINPIDETMVSADPKEFAYNIDLFVEHGSKPSGPNPRQSMPAWGDQQKLTPQQIADVISYVMSLNPAK